MFAVQGAAAIVFAVWCRMAYLDRMELTATRCVEQFGGAVDWQDVHPIPLVPGRRACVTVRLDNVRLGGSDLIFLRDMRHLQELHLEGSDVDDHALIAVASLSHLKYVNLGLTRVTDVGIGLLAVGSRRPGRRDEGDCGRYDDWYGEVLDAVERIVDERYPYQHVAQPSDESIVLGPHIPERSREQRLRLFADEDDSSELAERRRGLRQALREKAHEQVHDMDIYFLFGLMDACDMQLE